MSTATSERRDFKAEMTEIMKNWNPTSPPQPVTDELRRTILAMYERQTEISLATVRADGWPQANVVDVWNLGLMLYFQSFEAASKVLNIEQDSRVSFTLTPPFDDFGVMQGISMAAHAEKVENPQEIEDLYRLLIERVPHLGQFADYKGDIPLPWEGIAVYRLKPVMGCVLDFTQGYGHWDYVQFREDDFSEWTEQYA